MSEEYIEQAPKKPGLYWAMTSGHNWFNAIVHIGGEPPYLEIHSVWFPYNEDQTKRKVTLNDIREWGERIINPRSKDW